MVVNIFMAEKLPKAVIKQLEILPVEIIGKILDEANALESHCKRCKADQDKFGIYPSSSGPRAGCLDIYTRLKGACSMYEFGCVPLLDKYFNACNDCKCEAGNEAAEKVAKYFCDVIKEIIELKKHNEDKTTVG